MTAALIIMENQPLQPGGYNPLEQIGNISTLRRLVVILRQSGAKRIVVAGGTNHDTLVKHLSHMGVVCLKPNSADKYKTVQNVKAGVAYLAKSDKFQHIVVIPAAFPLVEVHTIRALLSASFPIAVPTFEGTPGYPIVLEQKAFSYPEEWQEETGLPTVLEHCNQANYLVPVNDPFILTNLQEQEDWETLLHNHRLPGLRPETKISIARETVCFGPGTRMLLTLLEETNSLRTACFQMGISYSKGLRMVENMEQQLGFEVVVRKQGGQAGGRSYLTPQGREFLASYLAYENESKAAVSAIFHKYFG